MSWRDLISKPGSFRGVEFHVIGTDGQFGRRTALHEYPGRDKPWVEDLGRMARTLAFDALVIGADYIAQRDRLIAVLEQPGAGLLNHPTFGQLNATAADCRVLESTAEGGAARFSLVFVEAGENTWPKPAASTPDQVATKADASTAAVKADFAGVVKVAGKPDYIGGSVAAILSGAVAQVRTLAGTVMAEVQPLAELNHQVELMNADLLTLVYEPPLVADRVADLVTQLVRGVAQTPVDALRLASSLWRFGILVPTTKSQAPSRQVELVNTAATARLVRGVAISEAARALSLTTFESYDQAAAQRLAFADASDELLLALSDDTAFDALRALRAAVLADITARGADLTRLVRLTTTGAISAVALAHQLYGDALRADEIMERNPWVAHPLFIPGGVTLEVMAE